LFKHLWTLIFILVLIMGFGFPIVAAAGGIIILGLFVYRFKPKEAVSLIRHSFDTPLILNSFLILVFQKFTVYTGTLLSLSEFFKTLPLPAYLIFALLFLAGGILSGAQSIIALCTPMAYAAMPDGGLPLMILLGCFTHAANQISPVHICLAVIVNYFKINMGDLIKKAIPSVLAYCVFSIAYYHFLKFVL